MIRICEDRCEKKAEECIVHIQHTDVLCDLVCYMLCDEHLLCVCDLLSAGDI